MIRATSDFVAGEILYHGVDVFGDGLRVMPGVSMGTLWPCAKTEDRKSLEGY